MKMTKRIISTIVLSAALFTSSAFACGTMTNGSKDGCLVESPTTGKTTTTRTETKSSFDFDKEILSLFRNFFGKIFG